MNRIQTKEVATFAGLVFLVCPLILPIAWGKCNLEAVVGSDRNYTFSLWGARIMRSCPVGDQFDSQTCRCNNSISNIRNGRRSNIRDVPWALSMTETCGFTEKFICSAVLIRKSWAVSAKHCTNTKCQSPVTKVYGGIAESGPKPPDLFLIKWAKVKQFHYDVEKYGDIVMLQLDRGMSQSGVLALSPINFLPDRSYVGHICMVVGFGAQSVDSGQFQFDGHLYDADVKVLAKSECYVDSWKDEPYPICVKPTDSSRYTCSGDSGGGLVCKDSNGTYGLLGVLSQGIGNTCGGGGDSGKQDMYAAAPPFNNGFIASYFADNPDPDGL